MKLIATLPCRNEAWCLGLTARVALQWVDEIVVLNHASQDATVDIIADLQREHCPRVHLISVPESQWHEMQHRQMMLELARHKGATHIAIVDADEVLTANLTARKYREGYGDWQDGRAALGLMRANQDMLLLPGYNLRCGLNRYHLNGTWGNRWFSTAFRDNERLYWAARQSHGAQNYDHHHREPMGMKLEAYRPIAQGQGGVMHLWGVSDRRLRAKHALYKVVERIRWPDKAISTIDKEYSWWKTGIAPNEPETWKFADVPPEWWEPYQPLMKYLDIDAEPWQEAETRRLVMKYGVDSFAGLDLFGVV